MLLIATVLIELITVIAFIVICFVIIGGVIMGNLWVGKSSALEAVQYKDSSITKIVRLEHGVWAYSKVVARDKSGVEKKFYIDSNILQNRTAIPITDE